MVVGALAAVLWSEQTVRDALANPSPHLRQREAESAALPACSSQVRGLVAGHRAATAPQASRFPLPMASQSPLASRSSCGTQRIFSAARFIRFSLSVSSAALCRAQLGAGTAWAPTRRVSCASCPCRTRRRAHRRGGRPKGAIGKVYARGARLSGSSCSIPPQPREAAVTRPRPSVANELKVGFCQGISGIFGNGWARGAFS